MNTSTEGKKVLVQYILHENDYFNRYCYRNCHTKKCFGCEKGEYEQCVGILYIHCLKCNKNIQNDIDALDRFDQELLAFYCEDCNIHYQLCYDCLEKNKTFTYFMNIIEAETSDEDGKDKDKDKDEDDIVVDEYYKPSPDYTIKRQNNFGWGGHSVVFNIDSIYFDECKYGTSLTGSCGGYYSLWKCCNCNNTVVFTDK